jgi:hypothetical protein
VPLSHSSMDMQQVLFQVAAESSKAVRSSPVAVHTPPRLNFLTCAIACRLLATNSKMQRSAAQACAAMLLLAVLCAAPAVEASSRQLANSRPRRRGPRVNIFTPTVDNFVQQRSYYRPLVGSTAAAGPVPLQQLQAPVVAAGYAQQQQQLPVYQFVGSGAQRPAVVVGQPTLVAGGRSVAAGQATVVAAQPRVVAAAPAVAAGPPINAEFLSLRHNLGSRIHATTEKWFSRMGWRG